MECLLVAKSLAKTVLEKLEPMYRKENVEIRGCKASKEILADINIATDEDYATEYLAPILSLKIVSNIDEAMSHIDKFGSKHTDTIVTENQSKADRFLREVDSSSSCIMPRLVLLMVMNMVLVLRLVLVRINFMHVVR